MSAYQYSIIPIGVVLGWQVLRGGWRWSFIDLGVCSYLGWSLASSIHANGHTELLKNVLMLLTLGAFPYLAGKLLIEQKGLRIAFIRRFVFLLFLDALTCIFEFRLGTNPLRQLFNTVSSQPDAWQTQLRFGFGRSSGPFGHSIFMGTMSGIALLLHLYAARCGFWERHFRWLSGFPARKSQIIGWSLVAASVMTLSRGPWIATLAGVIVASIGIARDRWLALGRAFLILLVGGTMLYWGGKAYVGLSGSDSSQEELASAQYRVELLNEYKDIALIRSFWGWGDPHWPKLKGLISIDNWYLLVTLTYGVPGLYSFLGMLAVPSVQLLWAGMGEDALPDDERALLFTQAGVLSVIALSLSTVFLGSQLFPLLFLFLGWADACLLSRPRTSMTLPPFEFEKVIA